MTTSGNPTSTQSLKPETLPHAIWLGPASGEFQRPFELLQHRAQVRLCSDLKTLSQWAALPNLTPPEFVVGASAWPGSWNTPTLEQISQLWPLTQWVELVGAWSQGAARTAPVWNGWQQVPAAEFEFALDEILDASRAPLPRTMTREERLLRRAPNVLRQGTRVGVFSRQRNQILPLLELLESIGCFGVGHWQQTPELEMGDEDSWREFSPEALIVNLSTDLEAALLWLRSIRSRWPKVPLVLLADVPRAQEVELARAQELGPLLGKPVDAARLANALRSLLSENKRMVH
jgi:hypothetical protein